MNSKRLLGSICLSLALCACHPDIRYARYQSTPLSGWESDSVLTFDVSPFSDDDTYQEELGIRTSNAYPFSTLELIVSQDIIPCDSTQHVRTRFDTVRVDVYNESGNPVGRGFSLYEQELPFRFQPLRAGDSLHVTIRHHMRRQLLPGVSDVGFKLVKP